ncbi:hypothetical protein TraAM80_10121 [Trypanosoma rangeli]|uniref:Uncharacterized protein n=1 Tax=Trypanosoma rangeli TaxID=5698 RepID=A0A3R7N3A0_TRYRA|nr:uncharacterized protein TraAM80_10121 [Trypanosoma rangeli]RNE95709.1 hypothetical protein TraAM80_10121 [Trypanosoma rangeli]|eukprot:RNE95709.1 hypothetical protein TraAM80_10121 [Trypanosoma rangeli]
MTSGKVSKKKNAKRPVEAAQQHERPVQRDCSQNTMETTKGTEAAPHPFLGRELRVELSDCRIIVGTLIAYIGLGDLLLQNVVEQRCYADGEMSWRSLSLLAIPWKHVTAMHRRLPDCEPISFIEA